MHSANNGGTDRRAYRREAATASRQRSAPSAERRTVLCFSHLRWDFVYQRPQHLMTRCAADHDVFYIEEPMATDEPRAYLERRPAGSGVTVLVPRLPQATVDPIDTQRGLLDRFLADEQVGLFMTWYYTPMSWLFSDHLEPELCVYDCMDELAAFKGAPTMIGQLERKLLSRADVVFTGGYSLYEAKRQSHPNVHAFPSSVDAGHFRQARLSPPEPVDQRNIPHPRLGFYGVVDERFDVALIAGLAAARPDWQIVLVGPVVKIDPATLPRAANIHYLGGKRYEQLPAYLAGWKVALMPFALNESTRFISPTKTPEYLAGGKPVVSTAITDVVRTFAKTDLVRIAHDLPSFVEAVSAALVDAETPQRIAQKADTLLGETSWDGTWAEMQEAMDRAGHKLRPRHALPDHYDFLVVGAGFAGSVMAERLAAGLGKRVLVVDKRPHIAGNAYDHLDAAGVLVHKYGPHIFHTNSDKVLNYLSRFTQWRPYEHRVLASVDDMLVPMPINLTTLSMLEGRELTTEQADALLASRAIAVADPKTSEDVVISQVGRELYEKFFKGYTLKQWGLDPSRLDRSVAARVPTRTTLDDRYFTDRHQCMPLDGYTPMFERMLDHPNIDVLVGQDYQHLDESITFDHLIFTGPVDEYFNHCYGALPYRSLRFEHQSFARTQFQPAPVVNYPSLDVDYTRITEYKYLTGQQHASTSICYEFPCADGDPYYPVPRPENAEIYRKYQTLADALPKVDFIGRLATYKYYNMDQVVAQALALYDRLEKAERVGKVTATTSVEA